MLKRKKIKTPKLKIPLWQEIIYLIFVLVAPAIVTSIELYGARTTWVQISIGSVGSLLILVTVFKKFFLSGKVDKIKQEIALIEHDYSIEIGNPEICEHKWRRYNMWLYLYNSISIALALALAVIFITALINQLIAFRMAAILILTFVLVGMFFKAVMFSGIFIKEKEDESAETEW